MSSDVPHWARGHDASIAYHAGLLADPWRMDAYDRAIRALVRPGDVVLDLGAGTGVLAMLCARAGATRVHAVESMPVAEVAEALVRHNGLDHAVTVHRADVTAMAPVEPVDLVVSDFMGRLVADDGMLPAVAAAARWLKPGGRFCPASVTVLAAPVALGHFAAVDVFGAPLLGLDLAPAGAVAERYAYGVDVHEHAVVGAPAEVTRWTPPHVGDPVAADLTLACDRPGRLRGLAGWFEAALAPGVTLSTAPGTTTHWGQLLLPLPAVPVDAGDQIEVRLTLPEGSRAGWRWSGRVARGDHTLAAFDHDAAGRPGAADADRRSRPPTERLPRADVQALRERAGQAAASGDVEAAAHLLARAVCGLLPDDADLGADLHGDLGAAWVMAGHPAAAVGPLLRALDGPAAATPEQPARLLVDALFRGGRPADGARALARYEAAHGPHPSGWTPVGGSS